MSDRSDMAILITGYLAGVVCRPEFKEHFKLKEVRMPNGEGGSPLEFFDIEFASGTTVRVRVEDVAK